HIGFAIAIHVRREHVHLMSARGQSAAKAVNGVDRTAVPRCGQVSRYDVEEAHALRCYAVAVDVNGALRGPGVSLDASCASASRSSSAAVANMQPTKNAVNNVSTGSEYACAETMNSMMLEAMMPNTAARASCDEPGSSRWPESCVIVVSTERQRDSSG